MEPVCCFDAREYTGVPDTRPCPRALDVPAVIKALDALYENGRESEAERFLEGKREEAALAGDYDIVAANIVADVIIALAPAISRLLVPGGALVASGIILPRREETLAALEGSGLRIERGEELEGWCALLCRKV